MWGHFLLWQGGSPDQQIHYTMNNSDIDTGKKLAMFLIVSFATDILIVCKHGVDLCYERLSAHALTPPPPFSHTSDVPPCWGQLWDKSISHGFMIFNFAQYI